jgi:uncharacterized protein (DUF486 family)
VCRPEGEKLTFHAGNTHWSRTNDTASILATAARREITIMPTILLLCCSNVFMTYAWYGHLKYLHDKPLWIVILISWGIAFFEYCFMVPANRLGYGTFTGFQLKVIQEIVTLAVFSVFAILVLKEKLAWNYVASFAFIMLAVVFAFGFKTSSPAP